jgi:hypothetical protein
MCGRTVLQALALSLEKTFTAHTTVTTQNVQFCIYSGYHPRTQYPLLSIGHITAQNQLLSIVEFIPGPITAFVKEYMYPQSNIQFCPIVEFTKQIKNFKYLVPNNTRWQR